MVRDETQSNNNLQVIFTTHSPLLTEIDNFDSIRMVRKIDNDNNPKITKLFKIEMEKILNRLSVATGKNRHEFTDKTLKARLHSIMTPWMNEGFFANVVVLVEGITDRAAILGVATAMKLDLNAKGITVIPCGGKTSMDRPYIIFDELKIPIYIAWGGDYKGKNSKPEPNRCLMKLIGKSEEDWPDFIDETATCLKYNLESKLKEEIGEDNLKEILSDLCKKFQIPKEDKIPKNPEVISGIMERVMDDNGSDLFLIKIVNNIINLCK